MNFSESIQELANAANSFIQEGAKTFEQSVEAIHMTASEIAMFGAVQVDELTQQSSQIMQKSIAVVTETVDNAKATTMEIGASGSVIADALKDLPKTAAELAQEMPQIANRLKYGAGLRIGESPRSNADVMQLFNQIPGSSKLEANKTEIHKFLADKHGSHIMSHQQGGSSGANNILWEVGIDNFRRGSKAMTGYEQLYIRFYNAVDSIVKNSGTIAKLGITATGTAVLTQTVVTAASYALDLYRGDITVEEFRDRVVTAAISSGIAAPLFFLIFVAVLALCPELTVLLSAPAVLAGFNALFGLGIAVPIIQSLIRHTEAGGFGENLLQGYQALTSQQQLAKGSVNQEKCPTYLELKYYLFSATPNL
jgi:hypothetical protein